MTQIKVKSTSKIPKVAGAIARIIKTEGEIEIASIGAGAVNQAVKAVATASGYVAPRGIELVSKIAFGETEIDGNTITYIKIICSAR